MSQVVYIMGSTRTGSTMLDLMLGSHPECFSMGELCLLQKRECGYCGKSCRHWKEYRTKLVKPNYYTTAFTVFKKPVLIDSSKKWRWYKERKKEDVDIKIIHLIRNGLDRLKTKKKLEGKIDPKTVMAWVNTHSKCEEIRRKNGGILVKYEDLNKGALEQVCEYLGIRYDFRMKEFWKHEHHGLLGSKTAYSLVKSYHNKPDEHGEFAESHGFNIAPRLGHDFLDKRDLKIFKQHFGTRLNKRLGYE